MSPLWSDSALARAAWTKAVKDGLIDERDLISESDSFRNRRMPRRPIRRVGESAFTALAL